MARVSLHGRSIAITGASSGIGAATALACAQAGMNVAIMARRPGRLAEVAARCRGLGVKAIVIEGDVTDAAANNRLIEQSVDAFGSLYAVYANAGYGIEKPFHEMTDAEMREIFETNFFGTLGTIRPALAHMLTRPFDGDARKMPRGHILICSSCLAKMTLPRYGAYSATKAAQNHIGRAMRLELEAKGIAVSTVHPISTTTELFDVVKKRSDRPELAGHTPRAFTQSAETVAACTVACLRRPKPEVWTGIRGRITRFGMAINMLLPGLPDVLLRPMAARW